MSKSKSRIPCDKNKLYREFEKRNLRPRDVAETIGHDISYFSKLGKNPTLSQAVSVMLNTLYHIKPEDYLPDVSHDLDNKKCDDEEKNLTEINVTSFDYETLGKCIAENTYIEQTQLDYKELYKTIYAGVYNAIKMALSDGDKENK